jgi:hypothetical protein
LAREFMEPSEFIDRPRDVIPNRPINGTNINGQLIEGLSDGGSLPG